ncbi:hypothetical protein HBB16_08935 [Pseudonocardia sp. MCCB 268]|nr:hypothetical protein [Pseudonocardia cytotoxica]
MFRGEPTPTGRRSTPWPARRAGSSARQPLPGTSYRLLGGLRVEHKRLGTVAAR